MKPLCRHCHTKKASRPRGLCHVCYYTPEIIALYPGDPRGMKREPTEAEMNEIIAEQSKPENLPLWWAKETPTP